MKPIIGIIGRKDYSKTLKQIEFHFNHYKDLKKPGTTKVKAFEDIKSAKKVIAASIKRYEDLHPELVMKKGVESVVNEIKKSMSE